MNALRYVRFVVTIGCLAVTSSTMALTLHRSFAGGYPQSATDARVRTTEQRVKPKGLALVEAARKQVGVTVSYVPTYRKLDYPNGDVPRSEGVCVDVVIRAMRDTKLGDLQQLVHEDMKANFAKYPQNWGLKRPDPNIDHRRVPNLQCYFKRKGYAIPVTQNGADYRPGDIVTSLVGGRLPHIMIVSDKKNPSGVPLVIHNIGSGAKEEEGLFDYPLTGHYRLK